MNQHYRILLVEDELHDAELNIREIKKVLPFSKFEIVDNRIAYHNLLKSYLPDIIISDFNMPSFDGLSALKIAQEVCPLTPFIMVTGSINEDTAVECMKAGAIDYVLKDSLKRLGSSVMNALEQSKIRKERMDAFETIKVNEAKYRYMFHNNPQPMWIYDVETLAFLEVNEAAIKHFGFTQEEFLSMTLKDIRPANELGKLNKYIKLTDRQFNQVGEWILKKKNGELISVEIMAYSIIFNQRNARHVLINDITKQKLAQENILKLSKGIEQSPASIEITDVHGIIEYVNPQFCISTGYSSEEIIGKHVRVLKSGNMPEKIYKDLWETISSGGVWRKELLNKKKDGTLFWEAVTITSIKNEKGITTNYIAIKEDITERKRMQTELIQAKERAEESDRLKSAFLANMSHEIRTPLNSIIGFSQLLGDPDFDQEQKDEFIQTIVDSGNNLLVIISDIMDFSMLEAQQMKIRTENISTKKLMSDLFNDFYPKANKKEIEFRIDQSLSDPDILIESDLYRIRQIFNNLIGNALKFTNKGYIEIGYLVQNKVVMFHVKDTGIGIDSAYHQSIFERFRQVDLAKTRKYGGNGLGLAISKNLVELLGGNIWVESEPDKFSNFFFTIPINNIKESNQL